MPWYHIPGNEQDVVVSTRVRFARNLENYPFTARMEPSAAREVISKVSSLLESNGFTVTDFSDISRAQAYALVEQHYASPTFIRESLPHAICLNEPCNLSVMLCEEDHIRLQCILPGLALRDAYAGACKIEQIVDERFTLAFDEKLGYLTRCPTNLGTAMRASVMTFLPALSMAGRMEPLSAELGNLGLVVRGSLGEGTGAEGYLYQISNQFTLGLDEEATLNKLDGIIHGLVESERKMRAALLRANTDRLTDRARRALGLLRYAHTLTSSEFLRLSSDVRLGVALGLIEDVRIETLTTLLIEAMPATLTLSLAASAPKTDAERDVQRAKMVRERLAG